MTIFTYQRLAPLAVAGLVSLGACADGSSNPTSLAPAGGSRLAPSAGRLFLGQVTTDASVVLGELKVCKQGNVSGAYLVVRTQFVREDVAPPGSPSGSVQSPTTVESGQCVVVAIDGGPDGIASSVTVDETSAGFVSVSAVDERGPLVGYQEGDEILINQYHGTVITYVNHVEPPPICDFITFGRLVVEVGGDKVVISGNAGGNQPGGGTLAEFHVEANGVDNHVANVASYGPIASGALAGLTNSRITTGIAKNGVSVELRLWDGGEPGKGTDRVYVKLGTTEIFGATGKLIDQGNMQYHSTCRGPG
ncbi:MAG: hypothetical protein ACJ79A_19590 [Gemmatimonadaceae bacterium]